MSSSKDGRPKQGGVGYGKPPVEHRFKPGQSGNPKGRPRKSARLTATTPIDQVVLDEAMRLIEVRENGKTSRIPAIQAVTRSLTHAALKGDRRAALEVIGMVKDVQTRRSESWLSLIEEAYQYKSYWYELFAECDRCGVPRPEPVPHPDEVVVDTRAGVVKYNGPVDEHHKAQWDEMLAERKRSLEAAAYLSRRAKQPGKYRDYFARDAKAAEERAKMIENVFPDEKTRRQPGFDLHEWRDRNGVLARLREQFRKRKKGAS